MNYETAKKLKDAGFPQSKIGTVLFKSDITLADNKKVWDDNSAYLPTLLELITACGEDFRWLKYNRHAKTFLAQGRPHPTINKDIKCTDPDPETAVARLWIALNTK